MSTCRELEHGRFLNMILKSFFLLFLILQRSKQISDQRFICNFITVCVKTLN